jgi:hypothetical protein
MDNWLGKLIKKLMNLLTFTIYIRMIIESSLLLSLSSISELSYFNLTSVEQIISFCISCILIIFLISFIVFSLFYSITSLSPDFSEDKSFFAETVTGTKNTKFGRIFIGMFLVRRVSSVSWVIFTQALSKYVRVIGFGCIQALFFGYSVSCPLERKKESFIEIINDLAYLIMTFHLVYFNNEEAWTDLAAMIVVGFATSITVIVS